MSEILSRLPSQSSYSYHLAYSPNFVKTVTSVRTILTLIPRIKGVEVDIKGPKEPLLFLTLPLNHFSESHKGRTVSHPLRVQP